MFSLASIFQLLLGGAGRRKPTRQSRRNSCRLEVEELEPRVVLQGQSFGPGFPPPVFDNWVGLESADWNTPANWTRGVPTINDNVKITGPLPGIPEKQFEPVTSGLDAAASVFISPKGHLTIPAGSMLTVHLGVIVRGVLDVGGTLSLGATTGQPLSIFPGGFVILSGAILAPSVDVGPPLKAFGGIPILGTDGELRVASADASIHGNLKNDGNVNFLNFRYKLKGVHSQNGVIESRA